MAKNLSTSSGSGVALNTWAKRKGCYSSEKENSAPQQLKSHGVRKKRCGVALASTKMEISSEVLSNS